MIEEFEKKDIVIRVQPHTTTVVSGLLRSYLEVITERLKSAGDEMNVYPWATVSMPMRKKFSTKYMKNA